MRFESSEFVDSRVDIDGHEHVGCRSSAARCRISGGDLPALINNNFDACRWEFSEAAARTVAFRQAMYHGAGEGGRRLVDETIEGIYRRRI